MHWRSKWRDESMMCPYSWVLAGISRAKLPVGSGEKVLKAYTNLRFLIVNIHFSLLRLCHVYGILLTEMGIYA